MYKFAPFFSTDACNTRFITPLVRIHPSNDRRDHTQRARKTIKVPCVGEVRFSGHSFLPLSGGHIVCPYWRIVLPPIISPTPYCKILLAKRAGAASLINGATLAEKASCHSIQKWYSHCKCLGKYLLSKCSCTSMWNFSWNELVFCQLRISITQRIL